MFARQQLHHLLDQLPDESLAVLESFMAGLSTDATFSRFEFRDDEEPFPAADGGHAAERPVHMDGRPASQDELLARTRSAMASR